MNLYRSLRVFTTVVDVGSFTRAAKKLGVTVASVSKTIEQLEDHYHVTLLISTTRTVSATNTGLWLYQSAKRLLSDSETLEQTLHATHEQLTGKIRVNAPLAWGVEVLGQILPRFFKAHPNIDIDIKLDDARVDLATGEYDLVLRLAAQLDDSAIYSQRIASYQRLAVASPAYLAKQARPKQLADVAHHPSVYYRQDQQKATWTMQVDGLIQQVQLKPKLSSNNSQILLKAVLDDVGVGFIPDFLVNPYLKTGQLTDLALGQDNQPLHLYCLRHQRDTSPKRVEVLIQFLREQLMSEPLKLKLE